MVLDGLIQREVVIQLFTLDDTAIGKYFFFKIKQKLILLIYSSFQPLKTMMLQLSQLHLFQILLTVAVSVVTYQSHLMI